MMLRLLILAGVAAAACSFGRAQGSNPSGATVSLAPAPTANEEMLDSIKMPEVTIEAILQLLETYSGRTIIRPAALPTTNFQLNIKGPIPKSEFVMYLESVLSMNQIGLAPMGERMLKVVPLPNVRTESPRMVDGRALELPASGVIMAKLFQLEFLRATEFGPQLTQFLNPQLGGPVIFDKANAIFITDSVATLQRIETLLEKLDRPITGNLTPKFYPMSFAKASVLVNQLRTILQGVVQNQLGTATTYSADDRTNQVVVISDPRQHPFFDDLIKKLDIKADPNTRNVVIHLKHANAKEVATLLSNLVSGQNQAASKSGQQSVRANQMAPGTAVAPAALNAAPVPSVGSLAIPGNLLEGTNEFSSLVTVLADERSNAVIVSGTLSDIQLISDLVDKIDILLAQVRIEVVIAEVTMEDANLTGISAIGLKFDGDKITGFTGEAPGLKIGSGSDPFAVITRPGTTGSYDLAGIVTLGANSTKSNITILANTTLATTHNKEADIFVGESRPTFGQIQALDTIGTGVGNNPNSSALRSSISYQEAGIKMKIKPLIGADGTVQLEIEQTFNAFGPDVALGEGLNQARINKREAKSFLNVGDKEIVVLGGYQSATRSKSKSRLGPIPIIGDLLGPRSTTNNKTELMVFIRPHVIRTVAETTDDALIKMRSTSDPVAVQRSLDYQMAAPATNMNITPEKIPKPDGAPTLRRPR